MKLPLKVEAETLNRLSLYLHANIPLSDAVGMLEGQGKNARINKTYSVWKRNIDNGKSLAQAFLDPTTLKISDLSVLTVDLGERSGSLPSSLKIAHDQIQRTIKLKKKIIGAMTYPLAILIGTSGLVLGLILFVFPKIVPLFESLKVKLPLSTRVLITFSHFVSNFWPYILLVVILVSAISVTIFKISESARSLVRSVLLKAPYMGSVIKNKVINSIFDSLETLVRGGEQLSVALGTVSLNIKYSQYKKIIKTASEYVTEGKLFSDLIKKNKIFPNYVANIISVGEKTGNIVDSLKNISEISREELDDRLQILTAVLEPTLMIAMSLIIGFIALSIILPIYGITSHFQTV